jgi:hypothetical protein
VKRQVDRVLELMRQRGEFGVTQVDFLLPDVADGGPPITRLGARVQDLEEQGHVISASGRPNKCVIYRLEREASDTEAGPGREQHHSPPAEGVANVAVGADLGAAGQLFPLPSVPHYKADAA